MTTKQALFYNSETGIGTYTSVMDENLLDQMNDPYVEVPIDLEIAEAHAWQVDLETFDCSFVGRPIMTDEVNAERDRRTANGFIWNGNHYACDGTSKENLSGAGSLASHAIQNGAVAGDYFWTGSNTAFGWITSNNQIISLDAFDTFALAAAAAEHVRHHVFKARELKDSANGIPQDYTSDAYWS